MRRAVPVLAALLAAQTAAAQQDEASIRTLAERLFGPVPREAGTILHPLPWASQPPVRGTTHVLVAQDGRTALFALVAVAQQRGQPTVMQPLVLGQAGDPAQCEVPPGMPEGDALGEFSGERDEESGLGQPIVTLTTGDGTPLIGLTWRVGERGNRAQAVALFAQDSAQMREVGCFVVRVDATVTYEGANGSATRRRVSSVWRLEPGPDAQTPLLLRDSARPQRPAAIRLDADLGRYVLVPPPEPGEGGSRRR